MNGNSQSIALVAVLVMIGVIAFGSIAWHYSRARSLLEQWASEHGFKILHSEYRYLRRGPFFWTSSKGQAVYFVMVCDRNGDTRSGYVRCGSWWSGMFSDKVEARWETWDDSGATEENGCAKIDGERFNQHG